jgi:hypothetical protein
MRVLVACEFSGVVRRAFRALGHDAWSCDLLPSEDDSEFHIQGDARLHTAGYGWDLMIAHPPCTFMANSGAKHLYLGMKKENGQNPERWQSMEAATDFFLALWNASIDRIAVENPIMMGHAQQRIGVPWTQKIQPFEYAHGETKATCLWLKNLPLLVPTNVVEGREARVHRMPPGPNRWKERSRTLEGIAAAMAEQWGDTGHSRETSVEMQAITGIAA